MIDDISKEANTAMRVLQTLKLLLKQDASVAEITDHLMDVGLIEKSYTNVAILKYLNTLKVFGVVFDKNRDKYSVKSCPLNSDLDGHYLKAVLLLEGIARALPEEKFKIRALETVEEFKRQIAQQQDNKNTYNFEMPIYFQKYSERIKHCEEYIENGCKLKVTYKDTGAQQTIFCEPKEIIYGEEKVYFRVFNPSSGFLTDILISDLIEVIQLPSQIGQTYLPATSMFKLKGKLAKSYTLRNDERISDIDDNGDITVVSRFEDRTRLLHRLLRYDVLCEVLAPKSLRNEIKLLLDKMISKYKPL